MKACEAMISTGASESAAHAKVASWLHVHAQSMRGSAPSEPSEEAEENEALL